MAPPTDAEALLARALPGGRLDAGAAIAALGELCAAHPRTQSRFGGPVWPEAVTWPWRALKDQVFARFARQAEDEPTLEQLTEDERRLLAFGAERELGGALMPEVLVFAA